MVRINFIVSDLQPHVELCGVYSGLNGENYCMGLGRLV